MNRQQRRDFARRAQKRGADKRMTELYLSIDRDGLETPHPPKEIQTGDKVSLNIELVKTRQNYARMTDAYKQFVEGSEGRVFTANVERGNLVSMREEPRWLFWSGDLNLVEKASSGTQTGDGQP